MNVSAGREYPSPRSMLHRSVLLRPTLYINHLLLFGFTGAVGVGLDDIWCQSMVGVAKVKSIPIRCVFYLRRAEGQT